MPKKAAKSVSNNPSTKAGPGSVPGVRKVMSRTLPVARKIASHVGITRIKSIGTKQINK